MNDPFTRSCSPYNFKGNTGGCFNNENHELIPDKPAAEQYKDYWTAFGGDGYPNSNKAWRFGDPSESDPSKQFLPAEDASSDYWVFHICDGSGTQAMDCGGQMLYAEHFGSKVEHEYIDQDGGPYGQYGWCTSRGWLDKKNGVSDENWQCDLADDECNGVPKGRTRTYCPGDGTSCGYDADHQSCPGPYIGKSAAGKQYSSYQCGWWNTMDWGWWPALNSDPGNDYSRLWGLNSQYFFNQDRAPTEGGMAGESTGASVKYTAAFMTFDWVCHGAGNGEDWTGLKNPDTDNGAMCFCDNEPKVYHSSSSDPEAAQNAYPPPGTKAFVMEYYDDPLACHVGNIDYFEECIYVYEVDLRTGEFLGNTFTSGGRTFSKESWIMFPFYRPSDAGPEAGPW